VKKWCDKIKFEPENAKDVNQLFSWHIKFQLQEILDGKK